MATFIFFGKYSTESLKDISIERTEKVQKLIKHSGGKLKEFYALLGQYDLLLIVELPDMGKAMHVSVILSTLTGIRFSTAPAVTVADFDKLAAGK